MTIREGINTFGVDLDTTHAFPDTLRDVAASSWSMQPLWAIAFVVWLQWTAANFTNPICQSLWDRKVVRFTHLRDLHRQVKCNVTGGAQYPPAFEAGVFCSRIVGCYEDGVNNISGRSTTATGLSATTVRLCTITSLKTHLCAA